jgi:hypothetical protein
MMPSWIATVTFVAFGCAAFLTTQAAAWAATSWPRMRALPIRATPSRAVTAALALGTGCVGSSYLLRGATLYELIVITVICLTLDFACCCEIYFGRIPFAVTLPALALLFASAFFSRHWMAFVSCAILTVPFAVAAFSAKGAGRCWSEVQCVMLGAIVLNFTLGILTLALACFVAVGIALARRKLNEPIVFAPYIAFSIELALLTPNAVQ